MDRPKINPPLRPIDKFFEALAAIAIVYMIAQIIYEYPNLDEQIPTHFGADGSADDWGSKTSILILPVVGIVLYAGMTIINLYPYIFNFPVKLTENNTVQQYKLGKSLVTTLKFSMVGIFLYIQNQTVSIAQERGSGLGTFFIFFVLGGTFIPIIIYFMLSLKSK